MRPIRSGATFDVPTPSTRHVMIRVRRLLMHGLHSCQELVPRRGVLESFHADTGTGRSCFVLLHTTYQRPFLEGNISFGCYCEIFQINIKKIHDENKEIIGNVKLFYTMSYHSIAQLAEEETTERMHDKVG